MRLLYIADGRSPIARNWICHFAQAGHEVHLVSSRPCPTDSLGAASVGFLRMAGAGPTEARGTEAGQGRQGAGGARAVLSGFCKSNRLLLNAGVAARDVLAPLGIRRSVAPVRDLIGRLRPDLVHAMRIPYEGMVAALAADGVPLVVSVWGNDFTLHARHGPLIAALTRRTVRRTDALHCDCFRDLRLAEAWGFSKTRIGVVLPSGGGIQPALFHPGPAGEELRARLGIPPQAAVVVNTRGLRPYVRSDTFFRSIPLVLRQRPDAIFVCCAMQGNRAVEATIRRLGIAQSVRLLPVVPREEMADICRLAQVTVSPSVHDGTPNTLLEAMACGCFPVAGDIESIREWIDDGVNGLLCDPASAESTARALLRALDDEPLRQRAAEANAALVADRADHEKVMARAEELYDRVVQHRNEAPAHA